MYVNIYNFSSDHLLLFVYLNKKRFKNGVSYLNRWIQKCPAFFTYIKTHFSSDNNSVQQVKMTNSSNLDENCKDTFIINS